MCEFASFLARVNKDTEELEYLVYDLESHNNTRSFHGISDSPTMYRYNWIDVHYLPSGGVDARGDDDLQEKILDRWPTFDAFWKDISEKPEVKRHPKFGKWKATYVGDLSFVHSTFELLRLRRVCSFSLEAAESYVRKAVELGNHVWMCSDAGTYSKEAIEKILTETEDIPYDQYCVPDRHMVLRVVKKRFDAGMKVPVWCVVELTATRDGIKLLKSYSKSKLRRLVHFDARSVKSVRQAVAVNRLLGKSKKIVDDRMVARVFYWAKAGDVAALEYMDKNKLKPVVNSDKAGEIFYVAKDDIVQEILLELGFGPTKGDKSAFELAVYNGNESKLKHYAALLGTRKKLRGKFGSKLFRLCPNSKIFDTLLELGAKPPKVLDNGVPLLSWYCKHNRLDLVYRLIKYGVPDEHIDRAARVVRSCGFAPDIKLRILEALESATGGK